MGKRTVIGVVCQECHRFTDKELKPGLFVCEVCGLVYAEGEVSSRSMGDHIDVRYHIKDVRP